MLQKSDPETAAQLLEAAQANVNKRWAQYAKMADLPPPADAKA
jgi:DNA mismatch repair protein MutH